MILPSDQAKFDDLVMRYIEWENLRSMRQQSLFEDMCKIASKEDIAKALNLNRKTLYNRHQWKKNKTNKRNMHLTE